MDWYRQVQFISAVPMPEDVAAEYGTTINGMWASPESRTQAMVREAHARGQRVLFSVPLIALTPQVYKRPEHRHLLAEACLDVNGKPALVPWYYWERDPVYSMCIYSPTFRGYLLDRCRDGIDRGMDVVNVDEINTSIGLMNEGLGGSGFCKYCLERYRGHLRESSAQPDGIAPERKAELARAGDDALRGALRSDRELYRHYRSYHEMEAFRVTAGFLGEIAAYAREHNPAFAITANVCGLGNLTGVNGELWGPMWGEHLDFVMMENMYQPEPKGPHLLLPRGKFTAWYRLGPSFRSRAPLWICPSIMVPKQLAGHKCTQYYLLMFLEAYANGGRWGYYWWPGVDVEARLKATAPEQLKDYIRFIATHRDPYEKASPRNKLAILYLNGGMRRRPEAHSKYLALAQALSEAGYQYDVIYGGDGVYSPDALDEQVLGRYGALFVPECGGLTGTQAEQLVRLASEGVELVLFAALDARRPAWGTVKDEVMLSRFWHEYRDADREQIAACAGRHASERIATSDPQVNVVRYHHDERQVLHVLNYNYDASQDIVSPVENLAVRVPWEAAQAPEVRWLSLDGERRLPCRLGAGELVFEVPKLDLYGLAILQPGSGQRPAT